MADTSVHREAEAWIVNNAIPKLCDQPLRKRVLKLTWGGSFEFDGVSDDGKTVVCVSTSASHTATGKLAVGKIQKIRADTLYLLNAVNVELRILVFTDKSMMEYFQHESQIGRFPPSSVVELRFTPLPSSLTKRLTQANRLASIEVSPKARERF